MTNPFTARLGKNVPGIRSENRVVKALGARPQPGSGAGRNFKGDGDLPAFLVEAKSTKHRSIGLKLDHLEKITEEAAAQNKAPALTLSFTDEHGNPVSKLASQTWVAVPLSVFQQLEASTRGEG